MTIPPFSCKRDWEYVHLHGQGGQGSVSNTYQINGTPKINGSCACRHKSTQVTVPCSPLRMDARERCTNKCAFRLRYTKSNKSACWTRPMKPSICPTTTHSQTTHTIPMRFRSCKRNVHVMSQTMRMNGHRVTSLVVCSELNASLHVACLQHVRLRPVKRFE